MKKVIGKNKYNIVVIWIIIIALLIGFNMLISVGERYTKIADQYMKPSDEIWFNLYWEVDFQKLYENKIELVKSIYKNLSDKEQGKFYELYNQYLEIPNFIGDNKFLQGYEEGYSEDSVNINEINGNKITISNVKTTQLSANCVDTLRNQLIDGEILMKEDFSYSESQEIPIILGYEYKDTYSLGDKISANYLFKNFTFRVKGILEKDCYLEIAGQPIFLDRNIIMPSFNCLDIPSDEANNKFQVRHYVDKIEGFYQCENNSQARIFLNKVKSINKECKEYGQIYVSPLTRWTFFDSFILDGQNLKKVFFMGSIIYAALALVASSILILKQQKQKLSTYSTLFLQGMNIQHLKIELIRKSIYLLLISNVILYTICLIINIEYSKLSLLYSVFLQINIFFIITNITSKKQLLKYMGATRNDNRY